MVILKYALALILLFSFSVHADEAARPLPVDRKCDTEADSGWTVQEKFVWSRVCIGANANFNLASAGYGGELNPKKLEVWKDDRVLRPSFLETILLKDKYRRALTRRGVRIVGARFKEQIDLLNADIRHELWLDKCLIEKGAILDRIKTTSLISFDGSKFSGPLHILGARIDGGLFMKSGAEFTDIDLKDASVIGVIDIVGSKVTGTLDLDRLRLQNSLFMGDGSEFENVVLRSAWIEGSIDLSGSKVVRTLDMDKLRVRDSLVIRDNAMLGTVILTSARIGSQLSFSNGTKVTGPLRMYDIRVGGDLIGRDSEFADVNLASSWIEGRVDFRGAIVKSISGAEVRVDHSVLLGADAKFSDTLSLRYAKVGGSFDLQGGQFAKTVDLTGATIASELLLGSSKQDSAHWESGAALILRNAKVDTIGDYADDHADSWPGKLDLSGFVHRGFGRIGSAESKTISDRKIAWFKDWLKKWDSYSQQPYEQLAVVMQTHGQVDRANDIRYASKEREREVSEGMRRWWATLLNYLMGYGHRIELTTLWVGGFVLLGWAVLYVFKQTSKYVVPIGLTYSLDMLIPLLRLREKHYDIDLDKWPRRYFYAHKVIGYVLASFMLAGLSGLTK